MFVLTGWYDTDPDAAEKNASLWASAFDLPPDDVKRWIVWKRRRARTAQGPNALASAPTAANKRPTIKSRTKKISKTSVSKKAVVAPKAGSKRAQVSRRLESRTPVQTCSSSRRRRLLRKPRQQRRGAKPRARRSLAGRSGRRQRTNELRRPRRSQRPRTRFVGSFTVLHRSRLVFRIYTERADNVSRRSPRGARKCPTARIAGDKERTREAARARETI